MKTLDLPKETYRSLFEMLLRIRIIEEKIAEIYPQQEMRCPVHLCSVLTQEDILTLI